MNGKPDSRASALGGRALVLGGAGSAGNAWVIGIVAGLSEAGLDATEADVLIGTSAGATAAAQIAAADPGALLAAILAAPTQARTAPAGSPLGSHVGSRSGDPTDAGGKRIPPGPVADHLERTNRIIASASDASDMRRRMGAAAIELEAAAEGSARTRWRATVASRLPSPHWPDRDLRITAVDVRTGEPVVFDRKSGVDLADAVAASCSSGAAYAIGEGRYIDGGYRRNENADLAAGYARVLVLSPFAGRTRHPLEWRMQLAAQVEELRAGGSQVETVFPDEASRAAFGTNVMDPSTRLPAARAGFWQGRALAGRLTAFWR